jgi:hypothetical protein
MTTGRLDLHASRGLCNSAQLRSIHDCLTPVKHPVGIVVVVVLLSILDTLAHRLSPFPVYSLTTKQVSHVPRHNEHRGIDCRDKVVVGIINST